VIVNDGAVAFSRAFGVADADTGAPVTEETVFEAASLSKPVFGEFAMTFVEDGRLDLDAPLWPVLPLAGLDDPRAARITSRMLLTHRSGLPNWRRDNPGGKLDLAFDPGAGLRYSGEGYEWLADALAKIEGVDRAGLERAFAQRVTRPARIGDSFRFAESDLLRRRAAKPHRDGKRVAPETPLPHFGAAFGLKTTAHDHARWLMSVMARRPVLSADGYDRWLAGQNVAIPADYPDRALGLVDWALGFQIYQLPSGRVHVHGGSNTGFTCLAVADFARGWSMSFFTNADQATGLMIEAVGLFVNPND
jgi:CubicO group peptidase (beta-lactamase class C family)